MPGNANSGGHNAKTIERLKDQDTYRGDRHGGHRNMEMPEGRPDTPEDLDGEALAEWERMVNRLEKCRGLSKVDDAAVYQYAKLFAEVKTLEASEARVKKTAAKLEKQAEKLDGPDFVEACRYIASLEHEIGRLINHLRMGRLAIRQYLVEFGMTPSARGRVKMPGSAPDRPQGKLMSFRGGKR